MSFSNLQYAFQNEEQYMNPVVTCESSKKIWNCSSCINQFASKQKLNHHIMSYHNGYGLVAKKFEKKRIIEDTDDLSMSSKRISSDEGTFNEFLKDIIETHKMVQRVSSMEIANQQIELKLKSYSKLPASYIKDMVKHKISIYKNTEIAQVEDLKSALREHKEVCKSTTSDKFDYFETNKLMENEKFKINADLPNSVNYLHACLTHYKTMIVFTEKEMHRVTNIDEKHYLEQIKDYYDKVELFIDV